jgi:hypothetical protein
MLAVTPWACESGRPDLNGHPRAGDPVLCRLSDVRVIRPAGFEPASTATARRRSSSELRAFVEEPPAGVEPAPQPYEGCVLPLTPQRRGSGDGRSRTCIPSVQARCSRPLSYVPVEMRTGGVEPPQRVRRRYRPRSSPVLSVRSEKGDRPDSNRYREDHDLECSPLHHGHQEAGTTGFEPATTRSTTERSGRAELRPQVRGWDSNPRSRAHEAREDSLSSTAHLPGWSRTSGLRFPKPAGWPSPPRAVRA